MIMGGNAPAPGGTVCVSCGGNLGVACTTTPSGWNCEGFDDTKRILCSQSGSEYVNTRYCCPGASGCTSSPIPY